MNASGASAAGGHTFFIPVMGTGFTIDASLKVGRFGISSVLSLVDDRFIEQMRRYHCERAGEPYSAITEQDEDCRARRITAYLDLLGRLLERQVGEVRAAPFAPGSDITRYFELLPEGPLRGEYRAMCAETVPARKAAMQKALRKHVAAGAIDVNIMTKLDRDRYRDGAPLPPENADALSALRGFARSSLSSSIHFSAGLNPRLYTYAAQFPDFLPDAKGWLKKRIVLKVSDFRSAAVQGRFLAKRGLWVSEYSVESGINCGGHAFTGKGHLMGPVLEEFAARRVALAEELHGIYLKGLPADAVFLPSAPLPVRLTAAGGVGTAEEHHFLMDRYGVELVGWGTPFLLVPEAVNVDDEHLRKLAEATEKDVYLSGSSPLGVPFWNLRNSASERERRRRIAAGGPGSPCPKGYCRTVKTPTSSEPVCPAARRYMGMRLAEVAEEAVPEFRRRWDRVKALAKSCICHDLSGAAVRAYGLDLRATPAVCCGPNIVNFSRVASLREMVDHIYGRASLLARPERPNFLLREISLYTDHLKAEIEEFCRGLADQAPANVEEFRENLARGIEYYRRLAGEFGEAQKERFLEELRVQMERIERVVAELTEEVAAQRA
jgi:hypothetical protein